MFCVLMGSILSGVDPFSLHYVWSKYNAEVFWGSGYNLSEIITRVKHIEWIHQLSGRIDPY
jgi:hypothetical protein